MVFCNKYLEEEIPNSEYVTILILVDGFLQYGLINAGTICITVTILILVDGFLQSYIDTTLKELKCSHNPYFSRWFSAILKMVL